jgi:hypothetical protein
MTAFPGSGWDEKVKVQVEERFGLEGFTETVGAWIASAADEAPSMQRIASASHPRMAYPW